MVPLSPKAADRQYVVHMRYTLAPVAEARSIRSHNHFFAALTEAWRNLPAEQYERFPTVDHLRKWALIRTGYFNRRELVCSSKAEAVRVAAFLRPADEFAVVTAHEAVVMILTARSQAMRAMNKQEFQVCKEAILDEVAALIDVSRKQLEDNAGKSA